MKLNLESLKYVLFFWILATTAALAQGQSGGPPPAPKPTKASVQRVVQMINADTAKMQAFCTLSKLNDRIDVAAQNKDQKTVVALGKQAKALAEKIGPEYVSLLIGFQQIDPKSPEARDLGAKLDELDSRCPK
jgi:hypothetical protein